MSKRIIVGKKFDGDINFVEVPESKGEDKNKIEFSFSVSGRVPILLLIVVLCGIMSDQAVARMSQAWTVIGPMLGLPGAH